MVPAVFPTLLLVLATLFIIVPSLIGFSLYTATRRATQDTLERGRELLEQGQPEQALRVFEKLTRQLGRNTLGREKALYWLARSYEELGREDEARVVYRHCLEESAARPYVLDAQLEQQMRERLVRLGATHVLPRTEATRDYWSRFKAERDRIEGRVVADPVDEPSSRVEPPLPRELPPV